MNKCLYSSCTKSQFITPHLFILLNVSAIEFRSGVSAENLFAESLATSHGAIKGR